MAKKLEDLTYENYLKLYNIYCEISFKNIKNTSQELFNYLLKDTVGEINFNLENTLKTSDIKSYILLIDEQINKISKRNIESMNKIDSDEEKLYFQMQNNLVRIQNNKIGMKLNDYIIGLINHYRKIKVQDKSLYGLENNIDEANELSGLIDKYYKLYELSSSNSKAKKNNKLISFLNNQNTLKNYYKKKCFYTFEELNNYLDKNFDITFSLNEIKILSEIKTFSPIIYQINNSYFFTKRLLYGINFDDFIFNYLWSNKKLHKVISEYTEKYVAQLFINKQYSTTTNYEIKKCNKTLGEIDIIAQSLNKHQTFFIEIKNTAIKNSFEKIIFYENKVIKGKALDQLKRNIEYLNKESEVISVIVTNTPNGIFQRENPIVLNLFWLKELLLMDGDIHTNYIKVRKSMLNDYITNN